MQRTVIGAGSGVAIAARSEVEEGLLEGADAQGGPHAGKQRRARQGTTLHSRGLLKCLVSSLKSMMVT